MTHSQDPLYSHSPGSVHYKASFADKPLFLSATYSFTTYSYVLVPEKDWIVCVCASACAHVCVCVREGRAEGACVLESPQFHTCLILSEFGVKGFVGECAFWLEGRK